MTEHYFSENPHKESSPITWQAKLKSTTFTFTSDTNVFSKDKIDFGSRLLIESFEEPSVQGDFLDLGCGYGPIGISIAAAYPTRRVIMSDVNERALALAEVKAKQNQLSNTEVVASDRFKGLARRQFAAVLTNPPIRAGKEIVHGMFEGAARALIQNGELWAVIQKKQGAPSAQKKINELFGNAEVVDKKKGYFILKAVKI